MERKLELKDIAGYLPYKMQMKLSRKVIWYPNLNEKPVIKECDATLTIDLLSDIKSGMLDSMAKFIPILRPISDLYKEITNNGSEPFIPIVELAEIVYPHSGWNFNNSRGYAYNGRNNGTNWLFKYIDGYFSLMENFKDTNITNQYQLFDKLNEWKIDYRGLIDAGLAVSVYDLEINPYK